MGKCVKCQKENAENTYRFAIVGRQASSTTQHYVVAKKTTTTVYEKLLSFERSSVCADCIKKERRMYVLKWTAFVAFFILCALSYAAIRTGSIGLWFITVLAIGTLIGAVCVFFYSRSKPDVFYASDIRSDLASKGSQAQYRFVPVTASLYCPKGRTEPDLKTFKERSGLRTEVADNLFENFVRTGIGDERIDSLIDRKK